MKDYGLVKGTVEPKGLEITSNSVFVASNIQNYEENLDGRICSGYKYNLIEYTKDEYMILLAEKNSQLEEELQATKIILGVE